MDLGIDKWPYCLDLTALEVQCVIEALATKATEEKRKSRELEYENNSLSNRTTELESRVGKIERSLSEGK